MKYLQRSPFIRILIPFLSGIILESFSHAEEGIYWLIILLFLFTALFFITGRSGYYREITGGVLFTLFFIFAGIYLTDERNKPQTYPDADYYKVTLLEKPVERNTSYRAEVLLVALLKGDSVFSTSEKLIIFFEKNSDVNELKPGSSIIFSNKPEEIENQGNPFEFDYKNYVRKQGIGRQVYLKAKSWINAGTDPTFRISIIAEKVRDYLLEIYRNNGLTGTEFEILSALTLGYKKSMDTEIRQVFAATGTSHVLAVSGLHVGIVYLVFNLFFGFMRNNRRSRVVYLFLAILLLWGFAFITGLSPSVQRSALMFTIVLIGENIKRPANIYNTLAASAFVLTAANPNIIFDVGFQLSYAAVTGIVYFQPRLNKLFTFTSKPASYLWGLFTVSVSAQFMTFPLSCYYFHQFPVYFWMANFIVIPLAFVFIFLGILILVTSPVTFISGFLARTAVLLVKLLYFSLQQIENIPGALVKGFNLPLVSLFLLFMIIFMLILFIETKKPRYLLIVTGLSVTGLLFSTVLKIIRNNNKEIIAYKNKEPLLHLIYGRENYVLLPKNISENDFPERETDAVIKHERLKKPVIIPFSADFSDEVVVKRANYLFFDGTIIGFEDKNHPWDESCPPDLIITQFANIDSSRYPSRVQVVSYAKYSSGNTGHQKIYLIREDGAWRITNKPWSKKNNSFHF